MCDVVFKKVYREIIWDPYYAKDIDKLERVQRQGARFITGDMTKTRLYIILTPLNPNFI